MVGSGELPLPSHQRMGLCSPLPGTIAQSFCDVAADANRSVCARDQKRPGKAATGRRRIYRSLVRVAVRGVRRCTLNLVKPPLKEFAVGTQVRQLVGRHAVRPDHQGYRDNRPSNRRNHADCTRITHCNLPFPRSGTPVQPYTESGGWANLILEGRAEARFSSEIREQLFVHGSVPQPHRVRQSGASPYWTKAVPRQHDRQRRGRAVSGHSKGRAQPRSSSLCLAPAEPSQNMERASYADGGRASSMML
jgi:hypothetical protein